MSKGTYEDFRDALRAFESGWDRVRYDAGVIQDWQLDQWAGGPVQAHFPQYSSWSQLTAAEWDAMSYRSTNSLGFVGYQFGEALLIDLGYYDDDRFYGNGAATNTWDGTWTGKNGVGSLESFKTAAAQEVAIQEAFGFNLRVIEDGLAASGQSLEDYLGTVRTYVDGGEAVPVTLTLTGIMAAAHLRGAWGTLSLLQSGAVSTDEFGTSILRYVQQFGGYDSPDVDAAIAYFEDRLTGDEGLGTPGGAPGGDGGPGADAGHGTAAVTEATADVVVTWAWGTDETVTGFDPATDTIFIGWIGADALDVSEVDGSVVLAVPSNAQSTTLAGVTLADLGPQNFTILDDTAAAEVLALVGGGQDHGNGDGGDPDMPAMHVIGLDSGSAVVAGFDPARDMIHVEPGVTGDRFEIFEESGDAYGLTVRIVVTAADGSVSGTTIFPGIGLADLTLGNFSVAEPSALNEVVAALGAAVAEPGGGDGYPVVYDADGSSPAAVTGPSAAGGVAWRADVNADDITGFDPAHDALDFGDTSVHGLILTKTPAGEVAIDSPWSDALQIVQGIGYPDLTIDSFGVVGNEHLRQDIGAVVSWETGVGPRDADTVYVRSHEYGVHEVVEGFDPGSMTLSFLYFGTRERLTVEDTDDGLVIRSLPTGQSLTLAGVRLADLDPARVAFHHDQVMEDNLEAAFGFDQDDVALVDRTVLLTPAAPAGQTTDGWQTRAPAPGGGDTGGDTPGDDPSDGGPGDADPTGGDPSGGVGRASVTWSWGAREVVSGFDTAADVIDFGHLGAGQVAIGESAGDLVIEVLGNGGHTYTLTGVQAEDLGAGNLAAADWNPVLDAPGGVVEQLARLGYEPLLA